MLIALLASFVPVPTGGFNSPSDPLIAKLDPQF